MKKKEKLIGAALLFVLALFIFIGVLQSRKPTKVSEDEIKELFSEGADLRTDSDSKKNLGSNNGNLPNQEEQLIKNSEIIVEIKGEVQRPDVYKLEEGSRINDLINIAGGLTENANAMNINRATLLNDGSCIIVGNLNDKEEGSSMVTGGTQESNNVAEGENKKININRASKEELMTLTGIGEVKAESILSYREAKGSFKSIEELAKVDGIGIKTVEKLKEKITL